MVRTDEKEHLAMFAALQDAAALSEAPDVGAGGGTLPASRLVAYARRETAVVDLAVEGVLRRSPAARSIHAGALGARALAQSTMAMAAAGGTHVVRMLGAHRVELMEEAGAPYLVIHLTQTDVAVSAIEVRDPDGRGARLPLGEPFGGIVQLRLDLSKPEEQAFHAALSRPDSAVFLL